MKNSITELETWEPMMFDNKLARPWGGGITYEIAIPLAVHLGCKKIVTIGWDIGDLSTFEKGTEDDTQRVFQEHFYGD